METILAELAARGAGCRIDSVPDDILTVGRHCLLDWFGCALAGSREPLSAILGEELGGRSGSATIVGGRRRASARDAALVNGAAGHALDFDDTHMLLSGHPTAPVLPAALAVAEELDCGGEDLLVAFIVGVEVECRVGALLAPDHYRAGWHATGTVGTIGAAAAVARLLGLDAGATTHALALAATQAAGLKASFGTMGKPLHAGKAATDGVLAARLAANGFAGNPAVLEAPQGLAAAAGGARPDRHRLEQLADRWTIRDTLFKHHAACYLTHASINAALSIDVRSDAVESVEVHVAADSLQVCNIAEPRTGLEGKFSLRATTAMALLGDDTADLATYSDARVTHPEVVALRDRVAVVPDRGRRDTQSRVVVTTTDGRTLAAEYDTGTPEADLGLQWARLSAKFRGLAAPVLGQDGADRLEAAIVAGASARTLAGLASV